MEREAGLGEFESWLLDAVLRDASAGMALIGTDLRFVWVNPEFARMYARPAADFAGQQIAAVLPGVDAARAEAALHLVFDQGGPATETFETAGHPEDAASPNQPNQRTFHWFRVHGPDGEVCGAGLIAIAGSGPATEAALRRSEERYRALVQGGAQIIWVASPTGEMIEDSAEWRWITGQTVEEFLGNGWLDSIHPEDRERVERVWRECLRTGRIFDDRFRMRARGGAFRHYDVRAVPIERDGQIAEWVGACTDVTSQREAEEMRGRLTDQLSAAALRTARLQQATAMLAEALDVEQVVEVITEVGRTAIGALRSAVALLDDD
jgi:PAS domain S-box-containing protein